MVANKNVVIDLTSKWLSPNGGISVRLPPPQRPTSMSQNAIIYVSVALAVLTMAITLALALVLLFGNNAYRANILRIIWSCNRYHFP